MTMAVNTMAVPFVQWDSTIHQQTLLFSPLQSNSQFRVIKYSRWHCYMTPYRLLF